MTLFVPKRVDTPELLDEHDAPAPDMERCSPWRPR